MTQVSLAHVGRYRVCLFVSFLACSRLPLPCGLAFGLLFLPALGELGRGVVVVVFVVSVVLLLASAVAYVLVYVQLSW